MAERFIPGKNLNDNEVLENNSSSLLDSQVDADGIYVRTSVDALVGEILDARFLQRRREAFSQAYAAKNTPEGRRLVAELEGSRRTKLINAYKKFLGALITKDITHLEAQQVLRTIREVISKSKTPAEFAENLTTILNERNQPNTPRSAESSAEKVTKILLIEIISLTQENTENFIQALVATHDYNSSLAVPSIVPQSLSKNPQVK